jgi:hypothetical protein
MMKSTCYIPRGVASQPAASLEGMDDVLLRYVPPPPKVVVITLVNFLQHFPDIKVKPFEAHAAAVIEELFRKYPTMPML